MPNEVEPFKVGALNKNYQSDLSLDRINEKLKSLEEKVAQPKPKDKWDKFSSLSTLISGLIVAFIGFYATNIYDSRSKELDQSQKQRSTIASELQVVEKFIPHLASHDIKVRSAALAALSAIGNTELAEKLSRVFGDAETQAAVTAVSKPEPQTSGTKLGPDRPTNLIDIYKTSIGKVEVTVDGKTVNEGTAFPVNKSGFLITAAHLIEPNASVKVKFGSSNANSYATEVVIKNDNTDVALLRVSSPEIRLDVPTLASDIDRLGAGEKISVLAFAPTISEPLIIDGITTGASGPDLTQSVSASLFPGMAGAPVFNSEGHVIGIVRGGAAHFPSLSFIVPVQYVRGLLATVGL